MTFLAPKIVGWGHKSSHPPQAQGALARSARSVASPFAPLTHSYIFYICLNKYIRNNKSVNELIVQLIKDYID